MWPIVANSDLRGLHDHRYAELSTLVGSTRSWGRGGCDLQQGAFLDFTLLACILHTSMTTIKLSGLLDLLPRGDDLRAKNLPAGFSYVKAPNSCFVEPDLETECALDPNRTSIILISAPGAVGKSTLAAELAVRTGAGLWDLSQFQVGNRTFSGTILEAYDTFATGVMKRLREGKFLFILDALDEAQVRAGGQNFDAFLADILQTVKEPREKPVIVLLARSDTEDWVHMNLEEAKVPFARYRISYFDEERAVSFISQRLDAKYAEDNATAMHRQQATPFAAARDALFALVYRLFNLQNANPWGDDRIRSFLGYAPVLEALTEYLYVGNYMILVREIEREDSKPTDPWQFLNDIVSRLLIREHLKVRDVLRPALKAVAQKAGWSDWDLFYKPDEQSVRVLAHSLNIAVEEKKSSLPPELANSYEEALRPILPQHPFLAGRIFANIVFKEYMYSWGLVRGGSRTGDLLREVMRNRETPFLPSQLFSRFVFNLGQENALEVDGRDFGVLYESFLSRSDRPENVTFTLTEDDEGVFATISLASAPEAEWNVQLLISNGGIHFWRRLAAGEIDVKGKIILGLPGQRFALGPNVFVNCGQIVVQCEEFDVDVREPVRINAQSYDPASQLQRLRVRGDGGSLGVTWPAVAHPWAPFGVPEARGAQELAESSRGDALRKLLMMFRRQPTRTENSVMNRRWASNQLQERDELLGLAIKWGVLERIAGGKIIKFNSDFNSLISLTESQPQLSQRAREFVTEFLGQDLTERILL